MDSRGSISNKPKDTYTMTATRIHWIRICRKSPKTETYLQSQIIRSTTGYKLHFERWVDPPYKETEFILVPEIFFIYEVKRSDAHRSVPFIKLVNYLKNINKNDQVWICPVTLDRLGNNEKQLDAIHEELIKAHKNMSIKPLLGFGLPFDELKALSCVMLGNKVGPRKGGAVVAEEKRDERMKVNDNAKNIYNKLINGDEFWGKIVKDGIKQAESSRPCPDDFEENWMACLNVGEGGDLTQLKIVTRTKSSSSEEDRGIGVYLRSSPNTMIFMKHGIPLHQISFVLGDLLHQCGGKDVVAKLNIHIFYDHLQSGYNMNNPKFMKFLNLYRLGLLDKAYFPSTTRPSRMKLPVLAVIKIGELTNTEVRFSMNIGEDAKQLAADEEERWSKNKKETKDYKNAIAEAQKNLLPTEAGEGVITQKTSSVMAKVQRKEVLEDVRVMYAEQLKSCEFIEVSDLVKIQKSMDTWNDDGDESSIESFSDEDEEGEENGEENLQDDDDMNGSTKKRRRNTEEDDTEEADEDNENNNESK